MRTAPRIFALVLFSVLSSSGLSGRQTTPPATAPAAELPDAPETTVKPALLPTGPTAVIDTTMGRITCRLYDKEAPQTVANFIGLAEGTRDWTNPATHAKMHNKPLYNGTTFHRVIPEFMIQGGDPLGTGEGDPGYMFKDEFNPDLNFDIPGRMAMANSGPDTNGAQFFITEAPAEHLNQHYNLFGQCDDASVEVVKAIARVPRDTQDKPLQPVVMKKITIVREGQAMPPLPAASAPAKPASQP